MSSTSSTETSPQWTVVGLLPCTDVALEVFGTDRLMAGSGWPVCLLGASYDEVAGAAEQLTADLTVAERAQVFGGTVARVYQLVLPAHARVGGRPDPPTRHGFREWRVRSVAR
jgi:predicted TIM-barrel fold metal-dependent hydrolase